MPEPLFIATERFDPSDGEKWQKYTEWARIPGLTEIVSLDARLCRHLLNGPQNEADWQHVVCENFRLDYFYRLDYLIRRSRNQTGLATLTDFVELEPFENGWKCREIQLQIAIVKKIMRAVRRILFVRY